MAFLSLRELLDVDSEPEYSDEDMALLEQTSQLQVDQAWLDRATQEEAIEIMTISLQFGRELVQVVGRYKDEVQALQHQLIERTPSLTEEERRQLGLRIEKKEQLCLFFVLILIQREREQERIREHLERAYNLVVIICRGYE